MNYARRALAAAAVLVAVTSVAAAGVLWATTPHPDEEAPQNRDGGAVQGRDTVDAELLRVVETGDADAPTLPEGAHTVDVTARTADGDVVTFDAVDETGDMLSEGQRVVLERAYTDQGDDAYYIVDFRRGVPLTALAALFTVAIVTFARWQGLRALAGLALSFAAIIGLVVPTVVSGGSPVVAALVGGVLVATTTLYLSHGVNAKTHAALLGTLGSLLVTAGLAYVFTDAAQLTGVTDEYSRMVNIDLGGVSLRGLLLAGVVIGAIGVLDDATVSQSATVTALRRSAPTMSTRRLVSEALSVGRDHIAATVNTLFLAYAGAALPLLIIFAAGDLPAGQAVTSEAVAVEVVRTLAGSVGLVAAVPLTTLLAAAASPPQRPEAPAPVSDPTAEPSGGVADPASLNRRVYAAERGDVQPSLSPSSSRRPTRER